MRRFLLCVALLAPACRDERPPAPTSQQSNQLNEAEDMLNGMANEEGPMDHSTGPSNSSN